ncbi:MAG: DUF192 domain-containing protein [Hyphomicrobiaceae bacterium]|nr:DUF192 domain-containing protein [Hyphomicrobiaceae bacterium]
MAAWHWLGGELPLRELGRLAEKVGAPFSAAPKAGKSPAPAVAADRLVLATAKGRHEISVEIADTPEKQAVGLMFRRSMAADHGMLFPYRSEQELTMWMSNTYISLDMVFIRGDGTVHRVARNTEPLSEAIVPSQGPVLAVLELIAGSADRYGIEPGNRVEHPVFSAAAAR